MDQGQQPTALPRALDVQRYAGAREQEIRALVAALQGSRLGAKFGVAALPRHLRRRAGSHKPFHGHPLRPNLKLQGKRRKLNPADGAADEEDEAAEGEAAAEPNAAATTAPAARLFTNRRMRRQPAVLQQQHRQSAAWTEASLAASSDMGSATAGGDSSGSNGSSPLRRLETHVWHAKRLAMQERYGWVLPAGAAGQGRGSRSFVHVARSSALMHDASYLCPLLLRGAWDSVHGMLSALLDPAAAAALAADWEQPASSGSSSASCVGWEQEVMLHHPGSYPYGAICPAQLLVCPSSSSSGGGSPEAMDVDAAGSGGGSGSGGSVQACVWVHPAAAGEAHTALIQVAAFIQVSIEALNVRRLELRGGAADTALAVALAGATASGIGSAGSSKRGSRRQQQGLQAVAAQQQQQQEPGQQAALPPPPLPLALARLQHGDAVQLLLPDPRLCKPVALGSAPGSLLQPPGAAAPSSSLEEQQELDLFRLQQAPLPLSEAELSSRRQQLRLRMLQLHGSGGGGSGGGGSGSQQVQERKQQGDLQRRGYCPAVLVRRAPEEQQGIPGWSLILPAGWVPPFWLAAAYAGCKPAGQREWRWLHTLQGQRCFPWDHPDTAAYAALMSQQQLRCLAEAARRPPSKQQLAAPPPPPDWDQLLRVGAVSTQQQQQQQRQQQQQQQQQQQRAGGGRSAEAAVQQQAGDGAAAAAAEQQQAADAAAAVEHQPAPMEADEGAATVAAAAAAAGPPETVAGVAGASRWYVARSHSAMAAALQGDGAISAGGASAEVDAPLGGSRPVAAALQQGLMVWRPRQSVPAAAAAAATGTAPSSSHCLLEAAVQPINTGSAAEGAALCIIAGRGAERQRMPVTVLTAKQQRRQHREAAEAQAALVEVGGDPTEAAAGTSSPSGWAEVGEDQLQVIGYVLSEAPRGAPRRCGALAAVAASAAWRLRSLQHWGPRQDGGTIEALLRNPGSATLFPVRLQLLAERRQA